MEATSRIVLRHVIASVLAILVPAAVGYLGVYLAVRTFGSYGWTWFLGLPFVVSFLSAFILRSLVKSTLWVIFGAAFLSIIVLGGLIVLSAFDGMICLLMAFPLAALIAIPGTLLGYALAVSVSARSGRAVSTLLLLTIPGLFGFEHTYGPEPLLRTVSSSVKIDAPIEAVWDEVIAFDRIAAPPTGIFRLGVAYPIQARIDGEGVGAVRYCVFSTGPFVEPITIWEPPFRLEFDVSENPLPMKEFSPYGDIKPPHLHDTFVSRHGRFVLREEDGRVVLEGTTWYYQTIFPDWYWHRVSDLIIHQIHGRVLDQIKLLAERAD